MRWIQDEDYDIGLTFWNVVTFIKYKNSVIIQFFKKYPDAQRYWKGL